MHAIQLLMTLQFEVDQFLLNTDSFPIGGVGQHCLHLCQDLWLGMKPAPRWVAGKQDAGGVGAGLHVVINMLNADELNN
jgi:hypothetical protein